MEAGDIYSLAVGIGCVAFFFGFWGMCVFAAGGYAERQNRDWMTGAALGLFFGPLGVLLSVFLPAGPQKPQESPAAAPRRATPRKAMIRAEWLDEIQPPSDDPLDFLK